MKDLNEYELRVIKLLAELNEFALIHEFKGEMQRSQEIRLLIVRLAEAYRTFQEEIDTGIRPC